MNAVLIKILAMGLALSQVTTTPDKVKTIFDPQTDQAEVVRLLGEGCAHIKKVFDIESINLDDLIATAMEDPEAMSGNVEALRGMKFDDLVAAFRRALSDAAMGRPDLVGRCADFATEALPLLRWGWTALAKREAGR